MSAREDDFTIAAMAVGFSLGFGFLTTWEAIKQTRANKNPLRSTYIYMIWGEIVSNIGIMVLSWLLLDGTLTTTLPVLWFILFFWVFETQLQPQIIINRIAIISESRTVVNWVKWGTVVFVGLTNISVFVIWIPSHVVPQPPGVEEWIRINAVYDRITKVFFLIVDALLNYWFVHVVKQRLVKQHRLKKYKPLINFNSYMMMVSILLDVMLTALLSLPNELVYIQFHPVAYMVKLKIEMSMASLITRLARGQGADADPSSLCYSNGRDNTGRMLSNTPNNNNNYNLSRDIKATGNEDVAMKSLGRSRVQQQAIDEEDHDTFGIEMKGGSGDLESEAGIPGAIRRRIDIDVTVHSASSSTLGSEKRRGNGEDELGLTDYPGHPLPPARPTPVGYSGSGRRGSGGRGLGCGIVS